MLISVEKKGRNRGQTNNCRPLGLETHKLWITNCGKRNETSVLRGPKNAGRGFPRHRISWKCQSTSPVLCRFLDMATRYPSCPHFRPKKPGFSSHFFVSDPPFAQQTCADAKEKHLNGGAENIRIPGYYGMSPAACRWKPGVVIISAFTVDFNMAFWTEDESKLGNLKLWRCTLPNQDDHVANERV